MLARRLAGILPPLIAGRGDRGVHGLERERAPARRARARHRAALPRAPSHRLRGGLDRRRRRPASRRGQPRPPRRALPRRAAGVLPARSRGPPPAARGGAVVVSRAAGSAAFPARFQLVAAANPCRRGCASSRPASARPPSAPATSPGSRGPLLDRIDLHLEIPAVAVCSAHRHAPRASRPPRSARASSPRAPGRSRASPAPASASTPAWRAGRRAVAARCRPTPRSCSGLAVTRLGLSARAHDRLLRVARTIADLAGADAIAAEHVAEAIQYRGLDRRAEVPDGLPPPAEYERMAAASDPHLRRSDDPARQLPRRIRPTP